MTTLAAPQTAATGNIAEAFLILKNNGNLTETQMVNMAEAILSGLPESELVWKQLHTQYFDETGREITIILAPKPFGLRWSDKFSLSVEIETIQHDTDFDPSGAPVGSDSRVTESAEFTRAEMDYYGINGNEKNSAIIHLLTFLCLGRDSEEFYCGLDLFLDGRL